MRPLRLRLPHAASTAAERLLEQAEGLFELPAPPVVRFDLRRAERDIARHEVAPPVFEDADLVADPPRPADGAPDAIIRFSY